MIKVNLYTLRTAKYNCLDTQKILFFPYFPGNYNKFGQLVPFLDGAVGHVAIECQPRLGICGLGKLIALFRSDESDWVWLGVGIRYRIRVILEAMATKFGTIQLVC